MRLLFDFITIVAIAGGALVAIWQGGPDDPRLNRPADRNIAEIRARMTPYLQERFAEKGLEFGAPVYFRAFKEERVFEVWVEGQDGQYDLFKRYRICNFSGHLGPKLKEGDHQSPEGFYRVGLGSLNPNSSYHLSFNLGFPNAYDRAQSRTGSYLMVHGDCVSVGCYAMTDASIEEIYVILEAALQAGQRRVDVHLFPFRMAPDRMARAEGHKWFNYWQGLVDGYRGFEMTRKVPKVTVKSGAYRVETIW